MTSPFHTAAKISRRKKGEAHAMPTVLLVGAPAHVEAVEPALSGLQVHLRRTAEDRVRATDVDSTAIAAVLVDLDPKSTLRGRIPRLRKHIPLPIYAIISDRRSAPNARTLYGDGAAGVIDWPKEALVLARFLAEMLSVRLVRGRTTKPDLALGRTIRARLRLLSDIHEVPALEVDDGFVSVTGNVDTLPSKLDIAACIAAVPGVTGVDTSALLVLPDPVPDATIRRICQRLLRDTAAAASATLTVSVEAGVVTLRGNAASRRELTWLRDLLIHVRGVRRVDADVRVSRSENTTDRLIAARLRRLVADLTHEDDLLVSYFGGVAVLSGSVEDLGHKQIAMRLLENDGMVDRIVDKVAIRRMQIESGTQT